MFTGDQPSLTEKQILDIVYKDLPHYYYKDSEGVVIGDIFIHINDYATTKLPLDLQILNLTWSDELLNPNSFLFQQYSVDLCRDVRNIIMFFFHSPVKNFWNIKKIINWNLTMLLLIKFHTIFFLLKLQRKNYIWIFDDWFIFAVGEDCQNLRNWPSKNSRMWSQTIRVSRFLTTERHTLDFLIQICCFQE